MSTTFGIKIPEEKSISGEEEIINVAFRSSGMKWTNKLACMLHEDTLVIPIGNTSQGIYTIKDIIEEINKSNT